MFPFLSLESRKNQRKSVVNYIYNILNHSACPNKLWAFMIKAWHFTFPWYLLIFIFISAKLNACIFCYGFLAFFVLLYIYFHGCFITQLEYKLYSKNFVNIVDPYLIIFNQECNNNNRFYGTFVIALTYFIVVSIILYYRFFNKIERNK
jgi:hypothetical protein